MEFDYGSLAIDAADLLAEFGAPLALTRKVDGDYDTATGEVDNNGNQVFNTIAVRGVYKTRDIDGTVIKIGDVRMFISPLLATTPKSGDLITFDGSKFKVVNSNPVKPATVVVLHDVQARSA